MARIGFIGLGDMGLPMALNLIKAGHQVEGFDPDKKIVEKLVAGNGASMESAAITAARAEIVITLLPSGAEVKEAYLGAGGILENANPGTLLIDCSMIDVETAREVAASAKQKGFAMVDAPVSASIDGAQGAALTFAVGGEDAAFARARPFLEVLGKAVVHVGGAGCGHAAKICNNMILGVSMVAVSEAFVLAEKFGLDAQRLFDVASQSSGQCWALTSYCPVPGPVPSSPANRDYQAGFTAARMLKDLKLASEAAQSAQARTPLGAGAEAIFQAYVDSGKGGRDFSGIIRFLRGE